MLVEDDTDTAEVIRQWLTRESHVVDRVGDGSEAVDRLRLNEYDVIVLDWDLPGLSGVDVCRSFRNMGGVTPVIMLTGKSDIDDKETGLDAGADDYLTKPFHPRELSARLRSMLRRPPRVISKKIQVKDLELHSDSRKVLKNGIEITLLPQQFTLLEFFMRHPDEVFSGEALLNRVWSDESEVSPETVRSHLTRLRQRIDDPDKESYIRTVHRVGYVMDSN